MRKEEMRKEFDEWFEANVVIGFRCEEVAAWAAWQASRASIKIEWPDHYEYTNSDIAGAAILDCRTAFQKAIK